MARSCVFCGSTPLTNEHVFPQWLDKVLPEQEPIRGHERRVVHFDGGETQPPEPFERVSANTLTQTTVKRVCTNCNSGWMNDLEGEAREPLSGLIQDTAEAIDERQARSVATWIAKTCLMAQLTEGESAAVPPAYYDWMYQTREPPPLMRIWIYPHDADDWGARMEHQGLLYGTEPMDISDPPNIHSTTIGLGHLAFLVLGSAGPPEALDLTEQMVPRNGVRIWPNPRGFDWFRRTPLGHDELWLLAELLALVVTDFDRAVMRMIACDRWEGPTSPI